MFDGKKPPGTIEVKGDITRGDSLRFPDVDVVIHLAGILESSHPSKEKMWKVNHQGTKNVWKEACRVGADHFVFMSTIMVYGPKGTKENPLQEGMVTDPTDEYGKSKLACESFLREHSGIDKPKVCILRPPVIYGPGMNEFSSGMKTFISIKKGVMPLVGGGRNTYNMLNVDNIVEALVLASHQDKNFDIFNINEGPYTLKEVIDEISKAMGISKGYKKYPRPFLWLITLLSSALSTIKNGPPLISWTKYRGLTSDVWSMSYEKAEEELGYRPVVSLSKGVKKTVEYYGWKD